MVGLFTELSVSMWLNLCRCRKLQVFNTAWPRSHIFFSAKKIKTWELGYFFVNFLQFQYLLIIKVKTHRQQWGDLPYSAGNTDCFRIWQDKSPASELHQIFESIFISICVWISPQGPAASFLWSAGSFGFIYRGSYSDDKGGGIHERWFRWDSVIGQ